ncbi:hypothetical protein EH31_16905 [Erythrobacter longus]|uniref:Uncharacterized protein n=1 Tax=Erythrobacter longus TaxID=1044 RepID=A0A074M7G6_ERYLO|nr:hypothetical protein EH31_16905 [Erythrobacter longus]
MIRTRLAIFGELSDAALQRRSAKLLQFYTFFDFFWVRAFENDKLRWRNYSNSALEHGMTCG